jgi:hypothetical protein
MVANEIFANRSISVSVSLETPLLQFFWQAFDFYFYNFFREGKQYLQFMFDLVKGHFHKNCGHIR